MGEYNIKGISSVMSIPYHLTAMQDYKYTGVSLLLVVNFKAQLVLKKGPLSAEALFIK